MASNLKNVASKKTSHVTTTSTTTVEKQSKEPPAGSKILNKTVRTETEQIENGYIISKNYDISYEDTKGNRQYSYYSKKWYSKEDPLTITLNDKSLADEFSDEG